MKKYKLLGCKSEDKKVKRNEVGVYSSFGMFETQRREVLESCSQMFAICKGSRPQKKRVHNSLYREQAGVAGSYVHTLRFEGSYITKVCKSKMF